ncbi:Hypothetical predicted protein [Octopus vulgaris]|uniref:Uncharacterized protein n=1 Tax=Octopus vulgaris TaxID=6645 RepID=A0AA36B8K4_OCTVU|nr:Hypothetical predicted protein [Octopus vulgaris]
MAVTFTSLLRLLLLSFSLSICKSVSTAETLTGMKCQRFDVLEAKDIIGKVVDLGYRERNTEPIRDMLFTMNGKFTGSSLPNDRQKIKRLLAVCFKNDIEIVEKRDYGIVVELVSPYCDRLSNEMRRYNDVSTNERVSLYNDFSNIERFSIMMAQPTNVSL